MIEVRKFETLGGADHGWLNAKHHFSFAGYHDPDRVNWGNLRVWNDDTIQPKTGFPPHPHNNMEIITYVRKGAITHRDNQGNSGRTEAGENAFGQRREAGGVVALAAVQNIVAGAAVEGVIPRSMAGPAPMQQVSWASTPSRRA